MKRFLFLGLLLVLFSTPIFALSDANLVAYYNFDETSGTTLIDVKGYDQNGVNTNATINQTGKINKAYTFNGTTSHIHSLPLITNNSPFTITAWIYPTVTSGVQIIYNSRSSTGERPVLSLELNGNEVSFVLRDNSDMVPGLRINSTSITPNNWYFVTATYSGADKNGSLYLNGVLQGTAINSDNGWSGINRTYIGAGAWDSSQQFNGLIDEIGIFDKNLSQTEINELYNSGRGMTYPFPSIFANFDYIVDELDVDLNDTSTTSDDTVIDSWEWLIDDVSVSTDQNYSFTGTELTDYNVCLTIQDTTLSLEDSICQTISIGDITPPTTVFSSSQIVGTTDQNITLTCTDNNTGCKAINYNIDSLGWNTITLVVKRVDNCDDCNVYYGTGGYEIPYSATTDVKVDHTWSFGFNTFNSSANQQIISQNTSSQGHTQQFYLNAGKLYYSIYANPTNYLNTEITTIDSNTPYYVVASIDFSGTSKIYVNNVEKWSQSLGTFAYGGQVQNHNTVIASTLNGIIYDVNITNTALNASQAETMYNYLSRPRRINSPINFLYSGAGQHSIQYYSTDNSDNSETIKTSNFTTYGKGRFYFKDENTGSDLTGVQVNFNGVDYDSGSNNYLDFNFQTLSSTNTAYLFTLSKSGYSTRYYQTDLNYFGDFNITFALLPDSLDTDVPFKVYETDETTIYSNTFVEVKDKDTNYTVGRLKTNSSGEVTFNIRLDDSNYWTIVDDGAYTYSPVTLTILYPKDEETLAQITERWKIEISQNLYAYYSDLNASKVIYLLPNTALPYNIKIDDMNGNYFQRTYSKIYPGNPLTDTLQPYLVKTTTGLLTTITTKNAITNTNISGITIKIYKFISGQGRTLVEQVTTDNKGQAISLLVLGSEYEFECYSGATFIKTYSITATSSTIFIYLQPTTDTPETTPSGFAVKYTPIYSGLNKLNVGTQVFTQTAFNNYGVSVTYTSQIIQGGVLSSQSYTGSDANKTFSHTINWVDINNDVPVVSRLTITYGGKNYVYQTNYIVNDSFGTNYNLLEGLSTGLRSDAGCEATGICFPLMTIALLLSIGLTIWVAISMGQLGQQTAGIVLLLAMVVFTYLSWIPFELTVACVLILLAFVVNERRN